MTASHALQTGPHPACRTQARAVLALVLLFMIRSKPWWFRNRRGRGRKHKLIRFYAVSDAAVHDSQELDGLLDKGNTFAGFRPSAALQSACRGDAFRLCSGSLTSMDSVVACLRQKKSQATPGCQAQYDAESRAAQK